MTCKIFYAISIYGNYYSPCPANFVLLLSILLRAEEFSEHSTPKHPPFSPRIPPNAFYAFTDISVNSGACCKGIFSSIPLSCLNPAVLPFRGSCRFPHGWAHPCRSLPGLALHALQGFFLDLFVFFPNQSNYFSEVSSTAFSAAFRLPAGSLFLWAAPFRCFSFLIFALLWD